MPGPGHEEGQQVELARGQRSVSRRPSVTSAPAAVDHEVAVDEHGRAGRCRRLPAAPQDRVDAQHQLARAEGLGDVVVGADLQADDPVLLAAERGEHDDGHVGGGAQPAARPPGRRSPAASGRARPGRPARGAPRRAPPRRRPPRGPRGRRRGGRTTTTSRTVASSSTTSTFAIRLTPLTRDWRERTNPAATTSSDQMALIATTSRGRGDRAGWGCRRGRRPGSARVPATQREPPHTTSATAAGARHGHGSSRARRGSAADDEGRQHDVVQPRRPRPARCRPRPLAAGPAGQQQEGAVQREHHAATRRRSRRVLMRRTSSRETHLVCRTPGRFGAISRQG